MLTDKITLLTKVYPDLPKSAIAYALKTIEDDATLVYFLRHLNDYFKFYGDSNLEDYGIVPANSNAFYEDKLDQWLSFWKSPNPEVFIMPLVTTNTPKSPRLTLEQFGITKTELAKKNQAFAFEMFDSYIAHAEFQYQKLGRIECCDCHKEISKEDYTNFCGFCANCLINANPILVGLDRNGKAIPDFSNGVIENN